MKERKNGEILRKNNLRDIKERKITAKWAKTKTKQERCEIKENRFTEQRNKNKEIAKRKRYVKRIKNENKNETTQIGRGNAIT